jgi:OPA family glycerol-3-phosphate transporter-like MFS transporter
MGKWIVAVCSLVYFVSYFARKDFAAVMAAMLEENAINKSEAGFIGMAMFIAYGTGQLISGYLGDKIKPQYLLIFGLSLTTVCNLLMPSAESGALMIAIWATNGLAQAMLWPPIVRLLADNLYREAFVKANFVVSSAAHVSTVILYLYVPVCLKLFNWQTVYFTAAMISAIAIAVFVFSMSLIVRAENGKSGERVGKTSDKSESKTECNSFALMAKNGIIPIILAVIMIGFLRDGIDSWLPTLYSEAFSREASESILISVILPIFSILSLTVITALHKTRIFSNEARAAMIIFGASALIAVPLYFTIGSEHIGLRIACIVLAALISGCMHACNFLYISCLPGRFAKYGKASTASGICNASNYVGAAVSMYAIASISEKAGWHANVISWMIIAVLGALLSLVAYGKYTKFIKEQN